MKTRIPSFHLFFDREFIVTFPMNAPTVVIGRKSGCHLRLNHASVSREHCQISLKSDGQLIIQDLKSTNTTRVNGVMIARQELHLGDVVDIGRCSLIFQEVAPSLFNAYGAGLWGLLKRSSSHTKLSLPHGPYQLVKNNLVTEFNVAAYERRYSPDRIEYIRKIPRLTLVEESEDREVTEMHEAPTDWSPPNPKSVKTPPNMWIQSVILLVLLGMVGLIWVISILIHRS